MKTQKLRSLRHCGGSGDAARTLTKDRYSGMSSSQLSMMNTRRTYSLMLPAFLLPAFSNRSMGARLGTNRMDLNSSWPCIHSLISNEL